MRSGGHRSEVRLRCCSTGGAAGLQIRLTRLFNGLLAGVAWECLFNNWRDTRLLCRILYIPGTPTSCPLPPTNRFPPHAVYPRSYIQASLRPFPTLTPNTPSEQPHGSTAPDVSDRLILRADGQLSTAPWCGHPRASNGAIHRGCSSWTGSGSCARA